jgi:membrane fusion protein (multidrug efflux system)
MSYEQEPSQAGYGQPKKKRNPFIILAGIVGAIGLVVAVYMMLHAGEVSTDDAAIDARVVSLSSKIPGYVKTLNIDDNQLVKEGDVLLEIDPTDYAIRRDKAAAALDAAKAAAGGAHEQVESTNISAPSNLESAKAQLASAKATWDKATADLKRMKRLSSAARSREQLDEAVANEQMARASYADANAKLKSAENAPKTMAAAEANKSEFLARVKQAEADLAQAEADLASTKMIAPMDGRITRRGVEKGDYIQPGQALASLVGVEYWVVANFKETQIKHMQPGQRVVVHVDSFPDKKLEGKIESLQAGTGGRFTAFPAENATGNFVKIVQRIPVKITFTTPAKEWPPLAAGMSVTPTVYTK